MIRVARIIFAAALGLGAAGSLHAAGNPFVVLTGGGEDAYAQPVARMVQSMIEYSRWPTPRNPVHLCVAGPTLHAGRLDGLRLSDGRAIVRRAVPASPVALGGCDALYIGAVAAPIARQLTDAVRGRGVLTIAEADPDGRSQAMFGLVFRSGALSFRLNIDAVSRSGLKVDPRVLRLAQGGAVMLAPLHNQNLPTLRQILAGVHLRLILFAVVLAAASLLVSGTIVIRNYAQRNLELIAHTVAYSVEPAVVFGDRQAVGDGIVSVGAVSGVDRVVVRDPAGQVLGQWKHPHGDFHSQVEDALNAMIWPDPARATIHRNEALIGTVEIYGNSEGLLRYALSGLIISLCCLALTVLATRILAQRLQRDVIEPLDYVGEVAHAVRGDRAFEKRVPSSGIAEIDRFGQDFNALLAELQGWHAGLTSENAELARRATHDALTGLGNRVLFEQTLADAITESIRTRGSFAVLYLDVDDFKQVNDRHGHECGDAALIAVAERLRQAIRHADHAFRLGGDEFAVVLAPFVNRSHVEAVVARIDAAMALPYRLPTGTLVSSSLSIGVAVYPDDGVSPQDLLRRADAKMYQHKKDRLEPGQKGKSHA